LISRRLRRDNTPLICSTVIIEFCHPELVYPPSCLPGKLEKVSLS
jgi:hypothetical protein